MIQANGEILKWTQANFSRITPVKTLPELSEKFWESWLKLKDKFHDNIWDMFLGKLCRDLGINPEKSHKNFWSKRKENSGKNQTIPFENLLVFYFIYLVKWIL